MTAARYVRNLREVVQKGIGNQIRHSQLDRATIEATDQVVSKGRNRIAI